MYTLSDCDLYVPWYRCGWICQINLFLLVKSEAIFIIIRIIYDTSENSKNKFHYGSGR